MIGSKQSTWAETQPIRRPRRTTGTLVGARYWKGLHQQKATVQQTESNQLRSVSYDTTNIDTYQFVQPTRVSPQNQMRDCPRGLSPKSREICQPRGRPCFVTGVTPAESVLACMNEGHSSALTNWSGRVIALLVLQRGCADSLRYVHTSQAWWLQVDYCALYRGLFS